MLQAIKGMVMFFLAMLLTLALGGCLLFGGGTAVAARAIAGREDAEVSFHRRDAAGPSDAASFLGSVTGEIEQTREGLRRRIEAARLRGDRTGDSRHLHEARTLERVDRFLQAQSEYLRLQEKDLRLGRARRRLQEEQVAHAERIRREREALERLERDVEIARRQYENRVRDAVDGVGP